MNYILGFSLLLNVILIYAISDEWRLYMHYASGIILMICLVFACLAGKRYLDKLSKNEDAEAKIRKETANELRHEAAKLLGEKLSKPYAIAAEQAKALQTEITTSMKDQISKNKEFLEQQAQKMQENANLLANQAKEVTAAQQKIAILQKEIQDLESKKDAAQQKNADLFKDFL